MTSIVYKLFSKKYFQKILIDDKFASIEGLFFLIRKKFKVI